LTPSGAAADEVFGNREVLEERFVVVHDAARRDAFDRLLAALAPARDAGAPGRSKWPGAAVRDHAPKRQVDVS
jgi:hypothetical protein